MSMMLTSACGALWLLAISSGEVTLEEIHAKWRERADRTRSIRLTWDEDRGSSKVTGLVFTLGQQLSEFRLDNQIQNSPDRYVSVCSNSGCRTYFPRPGGQPGLGCIWPRGDLSFHQAPLVDALRPFEPRMHEVPLDKYQLTKFRGKIDDDELIVLEEPTGARSFQLSSQIWVDSQRDFVPRKCVEMAGGKVAAWYLCEFEKHAAGVYLPSRWESHLGNLEKVAAQVTQIEAGLSLRESEFTIEFPLHTEVADKTTGAEYYIDRSGQMTPNGAGRPSPRPALAPSPVQNQAGWGALLATVATLAVFVVFLYRRRLSSE
ncbi:hypothetical protein AYO47_07585 [Planctomyces sp. SCGC AG-212-M04]|nr:hypothetical protein AYO47_07585 [Planctomyces sp. SCGC AG-212-M04]